MRQQEQGQWKGGMLADEMGYAGYCKIVLIMTDVLLQHGQDHPDDITSHLR
jgi:hypothetical protein